MHSRETVHLYFLSVIPAQAGIHPETLWIPAFAGMTNT